MYDAASLYEPSALERAEGKLVVTFRRREGTSVLADLHQSGCLKARFPRVGPNEWPQVVALNVSGGIAGGDRLASRFHVRPYGRCTIATQAAERIYRALPADPPSRLSTHINLGEGAAAEWLPQETILFDDCALDRDLDVELAADASFLCVESLIFGRAAMGETIRRGSLRDVIRIRRAERLVLYDALRLEGDLATQLARPAIAADARAMSVLVHIAPYAETRLDSLRAALADAPAECGASAWDGVLVARCLARDGARLRRAVVAGLATLREGRPLPRVWTC
jgi:urease accessory protein